jgi:hypothetical protein
MSNQKRSLMGRICRAYRAFFQPLRRHIIPLNSNKPLMLNETCSITARVQPDGLLLDCLTISNAGTSGGASDWIVNDIKINTRSQFVTLGDVPGDMFASKDVPGDMFASKNAIDRFVHFDVAGFGEEIRILVTYIGTSAMGCPFFATITDMEYDPGLLDIARDAISQALASAARGFSTRPH